ncbi:hypothetical protein ACQP2X_39310 [Actinoplanes sp. CA-131856]
MKDHTSVGAPPSQRWESLDDIDADIEAIPDLEIDRRLHDVMTRAMRDRLSELDVAPSKALLGVLAGTNLQELHEAKQRLQDIREQIRHAEAELQQATARRTEMLAAANALYQRLARTRSNIIHADPGDDGYITEILRLGQEILDQAKADAKMVREKADSYATASKNRADWRRWVKNQNVITSWLFQIREQARRLVRHPNRLTRLPRKRSARSANLD